MVIIVGNGLGDMSSSPWWSCLHFIKRSYLWERYASNYFLLMSKLIVEQTWYGNHREGNFKFKPDRPHLKVTLCHIHLCGGGLVNTYMHSNTQMMYTCVCMGVSLYGCLSPKYIFCSSLPTNKITPLLVRTCSQEHRLL